MRPIVPCRPNVPAERPRHGPVVGPGLERWRDFLDLVVVVAWVEQIGKGRRGGREEELKAATSEGKPVEAEGEERQAGARRCVAGFQIRPGAVGSGVAEATTSWRLGTSPRPRPKWTAAGGSRRARPRPRRRRRGSGAPSTPAPAHTAEPILMSEEAARGVGDRRSRPPPPVPSPPLPSVRERERGEERIRTGEVKISGGRNRLIRRCGGT
ncbi:hypothetical protein DAI22_05g064400 [Oryza sativa Japonica Group]|nr:hypothetical protein DAI22_05g064400 [Oryza sativa Japonica Group]